MQARLTELHIEKLFGRYSHTVKLNHKERITIIIGPNGLGKTVCLKFIEALFQKKLPIFSIYHSCGPLSNSRRGTLSSLK